MRRKVEKRRIESDGKAKQLTAGNFPLESIFAVFDESSGGIEVYDVSDAPFAIPEQWFRLTITIIANSCFQSFSREGSLCSPRRA